MTEFKQRLDMYRKSRHSIADDNRLAETVKAAPVKADLSIKARDRDGCYVFRVVKQENGWRVVDHWLHEKNDVIPDSFVSHDLTWLLRIHNANVVVGEMA